MRRKLISITAVFVLLCLTLTSCGGSFLSGDTLSVTKHAETGETDKSAGDVVHASDYSELYACVLDMVSTHATSGTVQVSSYSGDVAADIELICQEISNEEPLGAYAIYYINSSVARIVSYYELTISITYSHTYAEMQAITKVQNIRSFNSGLGDAVRSYADHYTVYSTDAVSLDTIREYVRSLYYNTPLEIVVLPEVELSVYPDSPPEGATRILDVRFTYPAPSGTLNTDKTTLNARVQTLAGKSSGNNDAEILLSLARILCDELQYDEGSGDNPLYGTAWKTLSSGKGDSEGYAMAYKALCDRLRLDCRVVIGRMNDVTHAWNIVSLGGEYYHVDISMCDERGEELYFLLRDADMADYWWDTETVPKCSGTLTYADLTAPKGPDDAQAGDGQPAASEDKPTEEGEIIAPIDDPIENPPEETE